jgi:hypothetical protein
MRISLGNLSAPDAGVQNSPASKQCGIMGIKYALTQKRICQSGRISAKEYISTPGSDFKIPVGKRVPPDIAAGNVHPK